MSMRAVLEAEDLAKAIRQQYVEGLPEHLRRLGEILRETVVADDMGPLVQFLDEQGIVAPQDQLEAFRDFLIVNRLDLKDLEPAARERLRARVVATEEPSTMTADFKATVDAGEVPRCRGCRYFVHAPQDGTPEGEKSCVQLGTKGADLACHGFTRMI